MFLHIIGSRKTVPAQEIEVALMCINLEGHNLKQPQYSLPISQFKIQTGNNKQDKNPRTDCLRMQNGQTT